MCCGFCYFTKTSHGIFQTEVQFNSILPSQQQQYWMCFLEILLLRRILRGKFKMTLFRVFSRRLDVNIVWKSHSTANTHNNTYAYNMNLRVGSHLLFQIFGQRNEHVLYGVITLYANFAWYLTQAYSVLMAARVNERCCIEIAFSYSFQNLAFKNDL